MTFDVTKLDAFRKVNLGGDKAIAKFNKETGKVSANGSYYGPIGKVFRMKGAKDLNNDTRSEFLRALGNAFGLKGMGTNDKGKATFTNEFMKKLKDLLGDTFKADDFGIAKDGTVTSGKPLTQRRISQIINQATVVGRGDYNAETYKTKLNVIKAEIAKLNPDVGSTSSVKAYFEHVEKCIDFLENDFENLIQENLEWDARRAQNDPDYNVPPFAFFKPNEFEGVPTHTRAPLTTYLAQQSTIKGLYHFEEYKSLPRDLKTPADVKANMDYVRNTTRTYIMGAIDIFLDAIAAGKTQDLVAKIANAPGACMDAKAAKPSQWREQLNLPIKLDDETGDVADHGINTPLNDCIYAEIEIANNAMNDKATCWNDVANAVKQALVGKVRPIYTLDSKGELTPLIENGKQVVRPVTAEDIDKIGQKCADALEIF